MAEQIIRAGDVIEYLRLKREGYACAWSGEGKMCMVKPDLNEPLYYVMNETDGILADPEPMTRAQCDEFMIEFRRRFAAQGYYASSTGRIPISELRLARIPEADL